MSAVAAEVTIAPALLRAYPRMNEAQREVVAHGEGPLLVIAGPGSGKTFSLALRAMNLLLLGRAKASELVVCTFTEKAAYELRDRIAAAARHTGYTQDLSELQVGTIHGICNGLLRRYRHRTPLGNEYETLDDLTQLLFLFDGFEEILGAEAQAPYLGRWQTKWRAIAGLRDYFNKITEELVDPVALVQSVDSFLAGLGRAYLAYRQALFAANRVGLVEPAGGAVPVRQADRTGAGDGSPGLPGGLLHLGPERAGRGAAVRGPGGLSEAAASDRGLQPGGAAAAQRAVGAQRTVPRGAGREGDSGLLPEGAGLLRERRGKADGRVLRRPLRLLRRRAGQSAGEGAAGAGALRGRGHRGGGQAVCAAAPPGDRAAGDGRADRGARGG